MNPIVYIKNPKRLLSALLIRYGGVLPDKPYLKILYRLKMGKKLNLKNPQSFTEKIQWLKLYNRKPEYTALVDKAAVKDIVGDKIGQEYIIPTLAVWESVEEIEWEKLPDRFVLKTTHGGGGGGVVVCSDKSKLDKNAAIKRLSNSMKSDIYKNLREWPYKNVPRRIIAEKYISNNIDKDLPDYKWYCFNGEPLYCQVIRDRNSKETIDFYDKDWNHQDIVGLNPKATLGNKPVPKPENLEIQLKIAAKLSKGIPFVRVDLYEVNDETFFGELTFYPASGIGRFSPDNWNKTFGELINLPAQYGREGYKY